MQRLHGKILEVHPENDGTAIAASIRSDVGVPNAPDLSLMAEFYESLQGENWDFQFCTNST